MISEIIGRVLSDMIKNISVGLVVGCICITYPSNASLHDFYGVDVNESFFEKVLALNSEFSDEQIFELFDQIVQDENQPVFVEDFFSLPNFTGSRIDGEQSRVEYPFDIITYFMRLLNESENVNVRAFAARMLGGFGDLAVDAVPDLIEILEGDDASVASSWIRADYMYSLSLRCAAAIALGDIGPAAASAVPALRESLDDDWNYYYSDHVRIFCASSLYLIGDRKPERLQYLIDRLNRIDLNNIHNDPLFTDIVTHLARIGLDANETLPGLIDLSQHENPGIYKPARLAVNAIEGSNETVIHLLTKLLNESDLDRRYDTIYSLTFYTDDDLSEAAPALLKSLNKYHGYELQTLCRLLIIIGGNESIVISEIIDEIDNREEDYHFLLDSLKRIGPAASDSLPTIIELINDGVLFSSSAVYAYIAIAGPDDWLIQKLIDLLNIDTTSHNYRSGAIMLLKGIGPAAAAALPALRQIAEGDDRWRAGFARDAIAAIENGLESGSQ